LVVDGFDNQPAQGYFAIYDGHGGRGAVDFVAKTLHTVGLDPPVLLGSNVLFAVQNFLEIYPKKSTMAEAWKEAYVHTDTQIAENKILYSGTTAVTAFVRQKDGERWLHVANVGDARAVLKYVYCFGACPKLFTPLN